MIITAIIISASYAYADIYVTHAPDGSVYFTNSRPDDRAARVVMKEEGTTVSAVAASAPEDASDYTGLAEKKARKHNVDPDLLKAVIKAESNWNPRAVSPKGARGLMQLMPATAAELGVKNIYDPVENIDGGARYLRYLLEKFNGNLTLALAAYNAGPARVERNMRVPAIPETVSYVRNIVTSYKKYNKSAASKTFNVKEPKIVRVVLEDGSVVFTNISYFQLQ
ncbi:MAG: lytic transglycosylase domain-containing protein [Dissulfurispiraceae bacterium]|nr:lytic transglycosylase domain-containing protein [Dissulfurispiraceae bacterium]